MKYFAKIFIPILLITLIIFSACSKNSQQTIAEGGLEPLPSFNPSNDEDLSSLAVNAFMVNNYNITVDPTYIDFNKDSGTIEQNDTPQSAFVLTNNSGQSVSFKFQMYSVSSSFSVLDQNKILINGWTEVELTSGESRTFYAQFTAWSLGTQTSYVTITGSVNGYITLPLRASVEGPANLKMVSTGYFCTDENAPTVDSLDFLKASYGQTITRGIKLCNTGGDAIKIYSAKVTNDDEGTMSTALDSDAYEDFLWSISDSIDNTFAFGSQPTYAQTFSAPLLSDYPGDIPDPSGQYNVSAHETGNAVEDMIIDGGNLFRIDVNFTPQLSLEAPAGQLYNAQSINATLILDTSLGTIEVPLLGASSGQEPMLAMSYKIPNTDTWRAIDLTSNGAAIYFGTVELFKDWVSNNSQDIEVKIENSGTGSKTLDFYGDSINGYFEYYWEDGDTPLSFPITLPAGQSQTVKIRYLPAPQEDLSSDYKTHWDFGQLYFNHTGGNGPRGKATLVGEQSAGYAVELNLGGSLLNHNYEEEGQNKNLCVFSTDPANPTTKTFTVKNNSTIDTMSVTWSLSYTSSEVSVTPDSGTIPSLDPGLEADIPIQFVADASMVGQTINTVLNVETSYPDSESLYASYLSDLESRSYTVNLRATGSETGTSTLCGGGVLGDTDTTNVTFIIDRFTMSMPPSLKESNRNPPPYKFHLPLEVNLAKGTARISKEMPFNYDVSSEGFGPVKQMRAYLHQASNVQGCAPLPTDPYRLEYEKGSWTGIGIDCNADETDGQVSYQKTSTDGTGSSTTAYFPTDTACLPTNGGEEVLDGNGTRWVVFYQDFFKYNEDCEVQFYGRFSTFAFKPDTETVISVFETANLSPNENEAFYEDLFKAYQFDSYITFAQDTTCGSLKYTAGKTITDPDEIKNFYLCLAQPLKYDATRINGFVNECAYFNFSIDAGIEPTDATAENPDHDSWQGFGTYEPHVDDSGVLHPTKYDMTIYNAHLRAFALNAGDRAVFFSHPGHLMYSDLSVTFTTKRVADEDSEDGGDWQERIAVNARQHFDKNQIFLEDGNPYEIKTYWTEDGMCSELSNTLDDTSIPSGKDQGGYGKGIFRYRGDSTSKIILSGWPINFDENNLTVMVALGAFTGKGNVSPDFTKADATTGQGKLLYFGFHGCMVAGDPDESQGCFDYQLDSATVLGGSTSLVGEYEDYGILPEPHAEDCTLLGDPGLDSSVRSSYPYMPCINFKIMPTDRDRLTNYYDPANLFTYDKTYYQANSCGGYGM